MGFGSGGFVDTGEGKGGATSATELVGEGSGWVTVFRELEFSFAFASRFTSPGNSGLGVAGETTGLAFAFAFVLAAGVVVPPAGIPASASPVAGLAGSTGLLFGSATRPGPGVVALVGGELRVKAKMAAKITSKPIAAGTKTFQGLKPG